MPPLALHVRCGSCDRLFDTGIRMDQRNFARATLASNYHTCPGCGQRGTYHKGDYIVEEDARPRAPSRRARNPQTPDR